MKIIKKIVNAVEKVCMELCVILLAFITIAVFLQVIIRKAGGSVTWVDESTRYAYVLLIILGTVVIARKGMHIRVTSFVDFLSPKIRKITETISYIFVAAMAGMFSYSCYFAGTKAGEVRFSIITAIKMSDFYYLCAFVLLIVVLMTLAHIYDILRGNIKFPDRRQKEIKP